MGPLGTEGVFRSSAERTMEILQQNSGGLLTILSAIVSDPLYKWTLDSNTTDEKDDPDQQQQQHNNAEAAQAIARIDEKLKGYEDGTDGEQQSVESQVALLVHQAQDVENLSHMFVGWAAYI